MSRENEETIEIYEKFGDRYLERNEKAIKSDSRARLEDESQKELFKVYISGLPKDAKIFEVGSAGGRDAKTLKGFGYTNIIVSDVADYFLEKLKDEGFLPIKFNLLTDDFNDKYDFILCWAVLVHFKKAEAKDSIRKMYEALSDGGRLALCVKCKDGCEEEWEDFQGQIGAKRYFSYWTRSELEECLKQMGFKTIDIQQYDGVRSGWLRCCARK